VSKVQPETASGRRKLSEETRAKLRDANLKRFNALSDEEKQRRREHCHAIRPRKRVTSRARSPGTSDGGPRNPLYDAPRADRRGHRETSREGRRMSNARPMFSVPDLPPDPEPDDSFGSAPGSPPAADGGPLPGAELTDDQVASVLKLPFALIAERRQRPHWELSEREAALIAEPLTRKLNEHAALARGLAAGGDLAVIGLGTFAIVSARLLEDRRLDRAEQLADLDATRTAAGADLAGESGLYPSGPVDDGGGRVDATNGGAHPLSGLQSLEGVSLGTVSRNGAAPAHAAAAGGVPRASRGR
jgi:hypothetical protein